MFSNRRLLVGFVATPLLAAVVGCGSSTDTSGRTPVFPAKGQVKFQGQAPVGAFIVLHPKATLGSQIIRPFAHVAADGTFELTSYDAKDGAPTGDYTLTVEWRKLVNRNGDIAAGPNVLPPQYSRPETSPLVVHIADSATELPPIQILK